MAWSGHREGQMIGAMKRPVGQKARDLPLKVDVSKHTPDAWGLKYRSADLSLAQKGKQLRDQNTRASQSDGQSEPDDEAPQSALRKDGWSCYLYPETLEQANLDRWTETKIFVREEPQEDEEEDDEEDEQDEDNEEGDDGGYSESLIAAEGASVIHEMGPESVVVKGGHLESIAADVLYDGGDFTEFRAERINTRNTHGSGCIFASAIAASLAHKKTVLESVTAAKDFITAAIRGSLAIGKGCGPVNPMSWPDRDAGLDR